MTTEIVDGNALDVLRGMDAESVQCVVTSPPYWGLRDYEIVDTQWGGWQGDFGSEPTPELYVEHSVDLFHEVKRVLRADGTLWLNLGDSYGSKQLLGMPWRVALSLQADGWYLRSAIVWAKGISCCPAYAGSVMPESVTDRPTSAYEMMFLLSKGPKYFYDAGAVREEGTYPAGTLTAKGSRELKGKYGVNARPPEYAEYSGTRNLRNVWAINSEPFQGGHFATWPTKLCEIPVKAGSSPTACGICGAPWERVTEVARTFESGSGKSGKAPIGKHGKDLQGGGETVDIRRGPCVHIKTVGWKPTCKHQDDTGHCLVLDPFAGASGRLGLVCKRLNRSFIGIELNPEYARMSREALAQPVTREIFA